MQPSTYGVDNRCLADALGQLGSSSRGVAVVDTDVEEAELRALADAGVCAIRVNFVSPQTWGTTTPGDPCRRSPGGSARSAGTCRS